MTDWTKYRKKGFVEMRPYIPGEDMRGISVSDVDWKELYQATRANKPPGGMIARNPNNHDDQWYVAREAFNNTYEKIE